MKLRQWKKRLAAMAAATALCGGVATYAQSSDAILDVLIKKGIITQQEANSIKEQADKDAATAAELYNKSKVSPWLEKITWKIPRPHNPAQVNFPRMPRVAASDGISSAINSAAVIGRPYSRISCKGLIRMFSLSRAYP